MKNDEKNDILELGGHKFSSRFILGSGKFSLPLLEAAVHEAGAQVVTLALRRVNEGGLENILDFIPKGVTLLPNTSGARNAEECVRIAKLAREAGCGDLVKVEVIRDSKYLLPDNYETIKATEKLANMGFVVMPYMYPDLNADGLRGRDGKHRYRDCGRRKNDGASLCAGDSGGQAGVSIRAWGHKRKRAGVESADGIFGVKSAEFALGLFWLKTALKLVCDDFSAC